MYHVILPGMMQLDVTQLTLGGAQGPGRRPFAALGPTNRMFLAFAAGYGLVRHA